MNAAKLAKKAVRTLQKVDTNGGIEIREDVWIETQECVIDEQKSWDDDDSCKHFDFTTYPYWLMVTGEDPVGISGADDSDLLRVIE